MIVISGLPYETEEDKTRFLAAMQEQCLPVLRELRPLVRGPLKVKQIESGLFSVTESEDEPAHSNP